MSTLQVAAPGRKVLVGWVGGMNASLSLARDLSLSAQYELLQQFVPELQTLRGAHTHTTDSGHLVEAGMSLEIVARFTIPGAPALHAPPTSTPVFGLDVLAATDGSSAVRIRVNCSAPAIDASCHIHVDATAQGGDLYRAPLFFANGAEPPWHVAMHAIVDHSIIELIVNNRTAIAAITSPPSEHHNSVRLVGADSLQPSMDYWKLDAI